MAVQYPELALVSSGRAASRPVVRPVSWLAAACWPWLLAAAACVLSLLRTGYSFGVSNNSFHIPIVLRFAELPQFVDDPFVLSLRQFVSPIYPLLSLVATEGNIESLFFAGVAVTHLLTLLGLLRIGEACGIKGWREQAALVFLLVAARGVYWTSPVGGDGLLVGAFHHSELARSFALLAIAGLLRGKLVQAGALTGLAFALNAFVGIWTLAPMAAGAIWHLAAPAGGAGRAARLRTVLLAGAAFAVPAAPIAAWIGFTTVGATVDFDYRAFLDGYFPNHFFLHAASWWTLLSLTSAVLAGSLAAGLLERGRGALLVLASLGCVFGAGVLVGMFVESRLVLNLHLLRVDGMLVLLSATLVAAATVMQVRQGRPFQLATAAIAVLGLAARQWPVVAAAMLLAHCPRLWPALDWSPEWLIARPAWPALRQRAFLAGVLVLATGGSLFAWSLRQVRPIGPPSNRELVGSNAAVQDWLDVQRWARQATSADAMFLVPLSLGQFRTGAQRRIWVDWKDGATAMWAPQTFHAWHRRNEEVRQLDGLGPALVYACAHGIDYVVLDLRPRQGKPVDMAGATFVNTWFEVHPVRCDAPG